MSPENGNAGYLLGAGPFPVPPEVFPADLQRQQAPHQGGTLFGGGGGAASPVPGTPREADEDNDTNPGQLAPVGGVRDASASLERDPVETPPTPGGSASSEDDRPKPVSELNREELEAELGDDVPTEGSGKDGNVVVEDLRSAVSAKREAAAS